MERRWVVVVRCHCEALDGPGETVLSGVVGPFGWHLEAEAYARHRSKPPYSAEVMYLDSPGIPARKHESTSGEG